MALASISLGSNTFGNLALLQACELLDLLLAISPEEFQLHQWLYISDTIDAVYQPQDWTTSALSDQIVDSLVADGGDDAAAVTSATPTMTDMSGRRLPLIGNDPDSDKSDYKAMTQEQQRES